MNNWRILSVWLLLLAGCAWHVAKAEETSLTSDDSYSTKCSGMWSKGAIPGGVQPFIKVTLGGESVGRVAMLIYEWDDFDSIGVYNNVTDDVQFICDLRAVELGLCSNNTYGQFIIPEEGKTKVPMLTTSFNMKSGTPEAALYKVEQTGYYCAAIFPVRSDTEGIASFQAWIEWKHPYGNLPSSDYPKLLFYGIFSLLYLCVGLFWAVQTFRYWNDILPVQHFLSGAIFFLTVEMACNWGFWEAYNQTGSPSYGLLALVALLNAGRNSISFFMLLIVCMGYSVVKPSLGPAMKRCVILACVHCFFGVVYSVGIILLPPETAGFLALLVIFPLALTMSAFYVWIFGSLTDTLNGLELRKQHVKALMYRRLQRLLIFSVAMVVVIFILNMFAFSGRDTIDWAAHSWKWRWIMLDGLLNTLYFVVFLSIIILWRPTSHNQRYGLQQISQDEEEALDLENRLRHAEGLGHGSQDDMSRSRNMADESAIFEVGDDDLTDDEGDRVKLVTVSKSSKTSDHQSSTAQQRSPHAHRADSDSDDHSLGGFDDDDDERAHLTGQR